MKYLYFMTASYKHVMTEKLLGKLHYLFHSIFKKDSDPIIKQSDYKYSH